MLKILLVPVKLYPVIFPEPVESDVATNAFKFQLYVLKIVVVAQSVSNMVAAILLIDIWKLPVLKLLIKKYLDPTIVNGN